MVRSNAEKFVQQRHLRLNLARREARDDAPALHDVETVRERRGSLGTHLSGGEQQMLALARILRTGARLLLLDEISEGLAPVIVQALARTVRTLRDQGYTIVMVEQNFRFAAPLADRFYIMEGGRIVAGFDAGELQDRMPMLQQYLGV